MKVRTEEPFRLPLTIIFVTKPCKALNEMQKKLTVLQQDAA